MLLKNGDLSSAIIGWFCSYTPVEIIQALGLTPYRLLPGEGKTPRADTLFTGNVCPYAKACLESALAGKFPPLAGVILVPSCNAMSHLANIWRRFGPPVPVFSLDVPRRSDPSAVAYFSHRLRELVSELGAYFHRRVTEKDLWQAIEEQRREQAPREDSSSASGGRPRLLLIGSVLPGMLREIVEEAGAVSVFEDACNGRRLLGGYAPAGAGACGEKSPFDYLAHLYLCKPPCPRMVSDKARRLAYLREIIATYKVDGVVYHIMKFCDAAMVDLALVKQELDKMGLPLLKLEGEYTGGNRGQWSTRIEAFREML